MAKSKMPPRSQAPLVARPPPPSQAIPPRPESPSMDDSFSTSAAAAAKKKKKKGKGKKADDDLDEVTFHTPALSTAPFSATAKAQADLLATASDLYRRIEADPQGIPDDDAYWTSLPAHLRTFIRNALPIGQLPDSNQVNSDDPKSRQASTQAMIAVAQQLAQAAHASQRQLQQHPPSKNANFQNGANNETYPPFPFDPSVFADLAMQTEQALPLHAHPNLNGNSGAYHYNDQVNPPPTQPPGEPLPAPVVMVNEFEDEQGDFEDSYYSDEELDQQEVAAIQSRDGWNESHDGAAANGIVTKSSTGVAKKKNKKKKKKGGTDATITATVNSAPASAPQISPTNPTRTAVINNQQPPLRPPAINGPAPSSRAAGKQPMTFNASSGKIPANTRSSMNGIGHNHNHGPITTSMGKRPASTAASSHGQGSINEGSGQSGNRAWSSSSAEERESIKEFWLGLNERERRNLIKIEKDGVLKKMKEQQKHNCSCAVCGRKRSSIEDELEVLYDAYYDELEQYANHQQKHVESGGQVPPPPGPGPFPGSVALDGNGAVIGANGVTKPAPTPAPTGNKRSPHQHLHPPPPVSRTKAILPPEDDDAYDEDLEDDEYEDEYEYEDEEEDEEELDEPDVKSNSRRRNDLGPPVRNGTKAASVTNDVLNFGSSLTVKGGILTVADDLLKNDGQKFLEMMEQLAERRALREEEVQAELDNGSEEGNAENGDVEDEEVEAEEDTLTDEQRMEEGRRMFQIFAARMFEQRVLQAYREKVAQERQLQLLRELEEEDMAEKEKEAKKAKENQKKKDKKRQAKQQKEEERIKLEEAKAAEEAAAKAKVERQREAELKKQDDLRLKREAEKRQKDEEKARKDEEKRKKQDEERAKEMDKERKKREKEEKSRLERETKEREAKEAKERKEEEERLAKEAAIVEMERTRREESQQQQKEKEAISSTPTSPSTARSQMKSTSSIPTGPSSPLPFGRKTGELHSNSSSPLQSRHAPKVVGVARPVAVPLSQSINASTSSSSLPAPPQGLPARPSTVSHAQQASLSIQSGVATAANPSATTPASLPRPPMQSTGSITSTAATSIGSPARQATPTNAATASSSHAKTIVSPPLTFAPATNSAQSSSATNSKSKIGVHPQVTQPIGRYSSAPFASNIIGTPTRSPPSTGAYPAGVGKSSPFESVLGSPTSVNSAINGLGNLNLGGSSQQQMPIGPIGGGLTNSSNLLNSPHARTTSVGGIASMEEYARQGGSSSANTSRSISRSAAPGPIGPIGRRRDPSMDEFGGSISNQSINSGGGGGGSSSSSSIFGNSNSMTTLPEKVLGSSALGGDDELVEPQPRRTSHHTAPISNSSTSLFGSGAFGVTSPWATSFASSSNTTGSIGGIVGGGSGGGSINTGIPQTPSTPSATSRLQSALGTGLTSPTGNLTNVGNGHSGGGSNAFGSLHHQTSIGGAPGLQSSLNSGGDPWTRAPNGGWDRARYAFEQPNVQQQMGMYESQASSQQQGLIPGGSTSSSAHPLNPFASGSSQHHNALRNMFGAPGTAAIGSGSSSSSNYPIPRHSNERGL